MSGCYGVYGVTNFWEHFEGEYEHGINLVDAAADAGIGHLVFSALPSVHHLTNGELDVPHFELKARVEAYARSLGLPATFVHLAYYFDNFLAWFAPQPQDDGTWVFGFPQGDTRLAGIAAEDVGGAVAPIFERRDEFLGKAIYLVGDDLPPAEYAEIMSRVSWEVRPVRARAAGGFRGVRLPGCGRPRRHVRVLPDSGARASCGPGAHPGVVPGGAGLRHLAGTEP
jgi:uncharacterized protein YbjT (DUF2867 family)